MPADPPYSNSQPAAAAHTPGTHPAAATRHGGTQPQPSQVQRSRAQAQLHPGHQHPRVPAPQFGYQQQGLQPPPLQYGHPGMPAHQGRRAVHQPQPGPQAPAVNYFQGYGSMPAPYTAANFSIPSAHNYPITFTGYTGYRGGAGPAPQGNMGSNGAMRGRGYSHVPVGQQRPMAPAVPRKSKALRIVNPETNEEVKISKADSKNTKPHSVSAPVAPPARKPLPLIDPKDANKDSAEVVEKSTTKPSENIPSTSAEKATVDSVDKSVDKSTEQPTEKEPPKTSQKPAEAPSKNSKEKPLEVNQGKNLQMKAIAEKSEDKETAQNSAARSADVYSSKSLEKTSKSSLKAENPTTKQNSLDSETSVESVTEKMGKLKVDPSIPENVPHVVAPLSATVSKQPTTNDTKKASVNDEGLGITENKVDAKEAISSIPSTNSEALKQSVEEKMASQEGNIEGKTVEDKKSAFTSKNVTVGPKSLDLPVKGATGSEKAGNNQVDKNSSTMEMSPTASLKDESLDSNNNQAPIPHGGTPPPPKRERPPSPDWQKGQRRKYGYEFLKLMRPFASQSKAAEFELLLAKEQISTTQRGMNRQDSGGSRVRRGGSRMASDPRGSGVLAPVAGGGYMGTRSAGVLGGGTGSYDFDLGGARNQRPPPVARNSEGGRSREGDLRGSKMQNEYRGGRFEGPVRGGQGPLDPYITYPPVEKLKKSENGWARNKEMDDEITAKVKQCRSLLNKLTIEKFEKIYSQIVAIDISSVEALTKIVEEIFEKTLFEPKFSPMYAQLCRRLDESTKEMLEKSNFLDAKGKPLTFRKILLKNCQSEFLKANIQNVTVESTHEDAISKEGEDGESEKTEEAKQKKLAIEKAELEASKAKKRMLGNIRFIGELYIVDLIPETTIHRNCVQRLLTLGIKTKEDETLEALCKLLAGVGGKLTRNQQGRELIAQYFTRINLLSGDHSLPARIRFMMQDLIEQRNNNWKARRVEAGAKTIAEIHKDIEIEERKKAEASAARSRSGRHGGGGDYRHNRRSAPPMHMTMGAPRISSNTSRASAQLERLGNRVKSGTLSGAQNVRLGPGGGSRSMSGGANGWNTATSSRRSGAFNSGAASGGTSLRPRSSRLGGGGFAALAPQEPKEGTPAPIGDARRSNRFSTLNAPTKTAAPSPPPGLKPDEYVKKKAKSIVEEYWTLKDMKEVKECIELEVKKPNHVKFIEFVLRVVLAAKISQRDDTVPFFNGLLMEGIISSTDIIAGFAPILSDLDNIEMDDPRASEFLSRYVASMSATGKLGFGEKSGLAFLTAALEESFGKRPVKFIVLTLHELDKALEKNGVDSEARKSMLHEVYGELNVDLADMMMEYNPMRGLSALVDMLKENKVSFLIPLLPFEQKLYDLCRSESLGSEMYEELCKLNISESQRKSTEFVVMIIRAAFTVLFSATTTDIGGKFTNGAGKLVKLLYGDGNPPVDVQDSVLAFVQSFLHKKESTFAPLDKKQYEDNKIKAGYIVFDALYDSDVVEENAFMTWKKDESATIMEIGGKAELLLQTASWFNWLETADEEN